jgi:hypothetical protein
MHVEDLVNFWKALDSKTAPFAHPEDLPILRSIKNGQLIDEEPKKTYRDFVEGVRFANSDDRRLELSLLPVPYTGDLKKADIIILLLNPGLGDSDYWGEFNVPSYRERIERTLRQDLDDAEYPFCYLDPEICWSGGFRYWEKKFHSVISLIANEKFNGRYLDALRDFSSRLATVELVPYHSPTFGGHPLIGTLPSVNLIQRFVRENLLPDVENGEKTLIVTRRAKDWGMPVSPHVIVYQGWETRGANLGPASSGGKAILRRYGVGQ